MLYRTKPYGKKIWKNTAAKIEHVECELTIMAHSIICSPRLPFRVFPLFVSFYFSISTIHVMSISNNLCHMPKYFHPRKYETWMDKNQVERERKYKTNESENDNNCDDNMNRSIIMPYRTRNKHISQFSFISSIMIWSSNNNFICLSSFFLILILLRRQLLFYHK